MKTILDLEHSDFSSDFDCGSLLGLRKIGPGEFEFEVQPREVYGPQGSLMVWFYGACDLSGIRTSDGDRLRMLVRKPHRLDKMRPVYSLDGECWDYVPEPYGPVEEGFRFEIPLTSGAERVYFAAHFPYASQRMYALVERVSSNSNVKAASIGQTECGRDIPYLELTGSSSRSARKHKVLLSGGSHAGETASLWGIEGIIDFLLSNCSEAVAILQNTVFHIVPMLNVDGAALGLDRRNANGVNIFADYRSFESSESRAMWGLVSEIKPDIWLDLHSWHVGIAEGAFGPDPAIVGQDKFDTLLKPLIDAVTKHFPIKSYGLDTLDCPITQALLKLGVTGLCPEFNMGLGPDGLWKTIADNKSAGVALIRGIADYFS